MASSRRRQIDSTQGAARQFVMVLGWVCLAATIAHADASHDATLAELDHDDFEIRETATQRLMADDTLTLDQLEAWARRPLSLEQQHRLLVVAQHHTLRQIRLTEFPAEGPGSIGVVRSSRPQPTAPNQAPAQGVWITQVLHGFPGAGRVRIDDRIVAINGVALEEGPAKGDLFQARMNAFEAGQTIALTLARGEERIEIDLTLANGAALPQMYPREQFKLAPRYVEAWEKQRRSRFAGLAPALIEAVP